MSLDTVLQIGKVLRNSENNLKYFNYVERCPKDKDGNWPLCITIPVKEDFSFDWERMYITPEKQLETFYYLNYTTSNNDNSPQKYLFGDICYTRKSEIDRKGKIKGIKEYGNFTFEKGEGNAFVNGQKVYEKIKESYLRESIMLDLLNVVGEKNAKSVLSFIHSCYKNDKPITIPDKLSKYNKIIEKSIEQLRTIEKKNYLVQFHNAFEKEIEKFNRLLLYAPAFTHINEEKNADSFFSDLNTLQENYLNVVKSKNNSILKNMLSRDESLNFYSNNTRNKLLQFADFTVFIHFEFENGKQWYSIKDAFSLLINNLNDGITRKTDYGLVPNTYIYRTLCSGNSKNDIQFPNFEIKKAYRSYVFTPYGFEDFLYTSTFLNKPFRRLRKTKIDLFIFPIAIQGKEISARQYDTFFEKRNEDLLQSEDDPLLFFIENENPKNFSKFDFVLSDSSGKTTNDLVEISGIEQSDLKSISKRIEQIALKIRFERKEAISYDEKVRIENALLHVLGTYQINKSDFLEVKENHRYKSHILKILPLIYTNNYHNDAILLPAFIENIEKIIRMVKEKISGNKYEQLKYELKYLLSIQNNSNNKFMEITSSESYQIGHRLGKLSKPLKKKINSFEKKYVGLLTRRVGTKAECIAFCNEIIGMLVRQEKVWEQLAAETTAQLVKIPQNKYDKEEIAIGFFEGYFHYEVNDEKSKFINRIEKIISDYEGKENLQEEIQVLKDTLEEIK